MTKPEINVFRIEARYAAVQGSYWAGTCTLTGFTAVYLSFKNFTNSQIGFTSSFYCIIAIILQIVISSFADSRTHIPLKKIISVLYIVSIAGCAILWLLPLPIAFILLFFSIAAATANTLNGLISALMMQFSNIGIRVNYGWPRGIGSICYALTAYILGVVVEKYSPGILMPVCLALMIIAIICVSVMPDPK